MSQDVSRYQGLVDARVLVGFKMYKSLSRDTLISRIALRQNQPVVETKKTGIDSWKIEVLVRGLLTFSAHLTS